MSRPDIFAFEKSGLGPFLFAEVGSDRNGAGVTILSVLARLGQDPWAEAARWAGLPKEAVIDRLTGSIAQMPLCPQALTDARATAARLILLLPAPQPRFPAIAPPGPLGKVKGGPMIIFYVIMAMTLALNMILHRQAAAPAPQEHTDAGQTARNGPLEPPPHASSAPAPPAAGIAVAPAAGAGATGSRMR